MNGHSRDSVREFIARVVEEQRGSYRLLSDDTEYLAELAGRFRHQAARGGYGLLSDDTEHLTQLAGQLRSSTPSRLLK